MSIFKIEIKAGIPATFAPSPITVVQNDSVFWHNSDPINAHWPAPNASNPKGWLDFQIPPDSQSSQISFNPGTYTLNYVCALHPNETGQIKVVPKKQAAFAPKTKKGAYGGKTKKGAFGSKRK